MAGADSADRVQEQAPTVGAWGGSTDPTPCDERQDPMGPMVS